MTGTTSRSGGGVRKHRGHGRSWRRRFARSRFGRWVSFYRLQLAAVLSLLVVAAVAYLLILNILNALPPGVR